MFNLLGNCRHNKLLGFSILWQSKLLKSLEIVFCFSIPNSVQSASELRYFNFGTNNLDSVFFKFRIGFQFRYTVLRFPN